MTNVSSTTQICTQIDRDAGAAALAWSGPSAVAEDAGTNSDSEPFPITVSAKPATTLVGSAVELSGSTLALLNTDVVVTIAAPKSTPPQLAKLPALRSADGSFKVSYVPKVAGTYTVDAIAPDGRGRASASFTVENPSQLSQATAQAFDDLALDADQIVRISRQKLASIRVCWICKGCNRPLSASGNSTIPKCVILCPVAINLQTKGRP